MGIFLSCCGLSNSYDTEEPQIIDSETKRRQVLEAAEKRQKAQEGRGLKDPEAYKRNLKKKEELEAKQAQMGGYQNDDNLRWTVK